MKKPEKPIHPDGVPKYQIDLFPTKLVMDEDEDKEIVENLNPTTLIEIVNYFNHVGVELKDVVLGYEDCFYPDYNYPYFLNPHFKYYNREELEKQKKTYDEEVKKYKQDMKEYNLWLKNNKDKIKQQKEEQIKANKIKKLQEKLKELKGE
jgi:hypothetical protein